MKSTLIINTKAPYSSLATKEAQDATLAFAAFGVPVAILLLGDGVFQLKRGQTPAAGIKDTSAAVESYPLYEIESVYVSAADMQERHLSQDDLIGNTKALTPQQIQALLNRYDNLLCF